LIKVVTITNKANIIIGLSGGVDSTVLLNLLYHIRKLSPSLKLKAVHVNHNLSNNAKSWENFCIDLCNKLDIPIDVYQVNIEKIGGESLENIARLKRYEIFAKYSDSIIVLAHHNNDQIETLISQIVRGSDIHNIAGMRQLSYKYNLAIYRPLIQISKAIIENYAKVNALDFIIDESNKNQNFLRNFIRLTVLPLLIDYDKNIMVKLNNLSQLLQDNCDLIDELASFDYMNIAELENEQVILVSKLLELSYLRQINVINFFLKQNALLKVSQHQIKEFIRQVSSCTWDKKPSIKLAKNIYLIKDKNLIFIRN
jgi:tRNA(Ile)-lysidine synthase